MKRLFRFIKRLLLFLFISHLVYLVALKWINPPITITQINSIIEGHGFNRKTVSWNEITNETKLAAIAAEDQSFAVHNGFAWDEIKDAMEFNKKNEGKRLRGGSTISQQTAKNVFLWQGRSWVRKGLEAYFTVMIEWIWGKKRILEIYLNQAETGIGTFGIEAAAERYFQKPASKLTDEEAARIIVNLPNPKKYRVNPPSNYVSKRSAWTLRQMRNIRGDKNIKELLNE